MRKFTKSFTALAVVMMLVMALFAPAMATSTGTGTAIPPEEDSKATINVATANEGDILHMFKVVNANFDPDKNTLTYEFTQLFKDFMTAKGVTLTEAQYAALEDDSEALNDVLGKFTAYVKAQDPALTPAKFATTDEEGKASFEDVAMGQYIIVGAGNANGAIVYSTVTAEVVPHIVEEDGKDVYKIYKAYDVEMKTIKEPSIEKEVDKKTESVGEKVKYTLTVTVPTYPAHATNTTFFIGDELSKGLRLNPNSISIKGNAGEVNLGAGAFTVDTSKALDNGGKFFIDFKYSEIKQYSSITVEYEAFITHEAIVGSEGNENKASLVFSNNPFNGDTWEPSEDPEDPVRPDPDDPENPTKGYGKDSSEEKVYTYALVINKYEKGSVDTKLYGATFKVYKDVPQKDGDGNYTNDNYIATIKTDSNGYATLERLAGGKTYYLVETVAPTGYNLAKDPIEVTIAEDEAKANVTTVKETTEYTSDTNEAIHAVQAEKDGKLVWINVVGELEYGATAPEGYEKAYIKSITEEITFADGEKTGSGYYLVNVENNKGFTLPGTGGIGTTIFYVVGGLLMAGAVVFLITKRRMRTQVEK